MGRKGRRRTRTPSAAARQRARAAAAETFREELEAGDIDDLRQVAQERDELGAQVRVRATRRPKPEPRRAAPAGVEYRSDADRVGGEPPFELTYTHSRAITRVTSLRAHMRYFFRVPKRGLLDDVARIYDELIAAFGPFNWLQKTTSQLYGAANAATLERARHRFSCPGHESCFIEVKAAELADDVAERSVRVEVHPRGSEHYSGSLSELHVTVAPDAMDAAFRDRFIDTCARLPSLSCASAGYYLDVATTEAAVIAHAMNAALAHPGAELPGRASGHLYLQPTWLSDINWLTAFGAGLRRSFGDDRLRRAADGRATLHAAGDAWVIQASPEPQLGRDGKAPAHSRLFAALERPDVICGLELRFETSRQNEWQSRLVPKRNR